MNTKTQSRTASAENAIALLKEGNLRFIQNLRLNRNMRDDVHATKEKQQPFAVVVSCMDSRTSPEIIFDRGLGDIFSIRVAGNVMTPEVIGSVEYACAAVGTRVVLVMGHTGCGAIKGAVDNVKLGSLTSITDRIRSCIHPHNTLEEITLKNVEKGIKTLQDDSEVLRNLVKKDDLVILGGVYDINSGEVKFLESVLNTSPELTASL